MVLPRPPGGHHPSGRQDTAPRETIPAAGLPGEGDLELDVGPDGYDVADADVALVHEGRDEVFAKGAGEEFVVVGGVGGCPVGVVG